MKNRTVIALLVGMVLLQHGSIGQAQFAEPIKVLLARNGGSALDFVARATLMQANMTMDESGLATRNFESASITDGLEDVFPVNCSTANVVLFFS